MSATECVFCSIVRGEAPAKIVREWDDAIAIVPLNPVTDGHLLVLPKSHVQTIFSDPDTAATTMRRVSEMLHGVERHHDPDDYNVITSAGRAATQTVMHFHVHLVPRRSGDGLQLPWTVPESSDRPMSATEVAADLRAAAVDERWFWRTDEEAVQTERLARADRLEALADSFDQPGELHYNRTTGLMEAMERAIGALIADDEHKWECSKRTRNLACDCGLISIPLWRLPRSKVGS